MKSGSLIQVKLCPVHYKSGIDIVTNIKFELIISKSILSHMQVKPKLCAVYDKSCIDIARSFLSLQHDYMYASQF